MNINRSILYDDYDKISDDMFYLGNNITLKFNVSLSSKYKSNNINNDMRHYFHQEYKYPSKYKEKDNLLSIRRSYGYYLSIDVAKEWECSVMIRVQDILLFRNAINQASSWAQDGTFVIAGRKKELRLSKKLEPIKVQLPDNKFVWFEPVVIFNNDIYYPGVRLTVTKESVFTDITMDNFFGLVYLINQLDMFGYAQNMINYINRPQYGYNLHEFDDDSYMEPPQTITRAQTNRSLPGIKNKSKFDDMME